MNANDLITDFALRAGVAGLKLNEMGVARLMVDERLSVFFEQDSDESRLHLYTSLGSAPAEGRELFFTRLLAANLFNRRTAGATIGYDESANELLLSRTLDLESCTPTLFDAALEGLIQVSESLQAEFASIPSQMDNATGSVQPAGEERMPFFDNILRV